MSAPDFSDLFLDRNQPLQKQLYKVLTNWITNGRLAAGAKLPSSRRMSECLKISRNTVTQVIEQLKNEGFLFSRAGTGVFVSYQLPHCVNSKINNLQFGNSNNWSDLPALSKHSEILKLQSPQLLQWPSNLPFSPGVPDLRAFPFSIWNKIYRQHQDRVSISGYGEPIGYFPLREKLSEYLLLSRGVRCSPDQIIITNGRQEAVNICAQTILNYGDTVLMENPGYRGARIAFGSMNAKIRLIELKENRLDVCQILKENLGAKIIYTSPTHQHPMGGIIPPLERSKLLDWAGRSKCWILEDESNSLFSFTEKPQAALQGMRENSPVIFIGSFNRVLIPSLRLGYLVAPKPLVSAFTNTKSFFSGPSTSLYQAVLADFMEEGHFVRHVRKMQKCYREKWKHFCELIKSQLEPYVTLVKSSASMYVIIITPNYNDIYLAKKLNQRGFGSAALSLSYANKPNKSGLMIGCVNTTRLQREQFVEYLKGLLKK
ncbi:PLP-dependent aminotransferase family protein [Microbulbifer sp. A4B17]|uniref:MocR-like pyridoxine biosynthesis transcription factor PdxR n=1 Tax=Microbulbifer sp. A4B17 TaxID=359370 RepID=UPI0018644383|nr:PLP-dependent aminotransferase family protein [Microbulbifer sp. A4B17]